MSEIAQENVKFCKDCKFKGWIGVQIIPVVQRVSILRRSDET